MWSEVNSKSKYFLRFLLCSFTWWKSNQSSNVKEDDLKEKFVQQHVEYVSTLASEHKVMGIIHTSESLNK